MQDQEKERHDPDPVTRLNHVLTNWLVVIAHFYHLYHQLSTSLDSTALSQTTCSRTGWLGQCPIYQLIDLQDRMQCELKKLNLEMEHFVQQSIPARYETLVAHTRRLEAFNQQATSLLRLVSLSAS